MNRWTILTSLIILTGSMMFTAPVRGNQDYALMGWCSYNSHVIHHGIYTYYSHYGELPESMSVLIEGGWVPPNITNYFTGERITSDVEDESLGSYAINRISPSELELVFFTSRGPLEITWDQDTIASVTMGFTMERAQRHLYILWGRYCLEAYDLNTGELPSSIADLIQTGFWPFENATNIYTGAPMRFDSHVLGDMFWEFGVDQITARLWLEPASDGVTSFGFIQYP